MTKAQDNDEAVRDGSKKSLAIPGVLQPEALGTPQIVANPEDVGDSAPMDTFTVLIDRDAHTRIPVTVRGFEVPIMVEIYGEDRLFVVGQEPADPEADEDFDVQQAYDALRTKYARNEGQVKAVYSSVAKFAKAIGEKPPAAGTSATGKDKQSSQKIRKPAKKSAKG